MPGKLAFAKYSGTSAPGYLRYVGDTVVGGGWKKGDGCYQPCRITAQRSFLRTFMAPSAADIMAFAIMLTTSRRGGQP